MKKKTELQELPLNQIHAKENYRKTFVDKSLAELSQSIKANGVIEPIIVRPDGEGYAIVAGERRFRASQLAGLVTIPAGIFQLTFMREEYDQLTDATRDGLTDNVKPAAAGWGKSHETIYQILRSEKQDPYAYWRSFYMGMLAGGVSTEPWDRDMAFLRAKHVGTNRTSQAISRQPGEAFSDGFHGFNVLFERFMASMADGTLDARETDDLLDILGIVRPQVEQLHTSLIAHKAKLDKDDYNGSQQSVAGSRQKA